MPIIGNLDDLKQITRQMEVYWNPLHKVMEEDEEYYDLDFEDELSMPTEFATDATVLPTARSNVDAIVDHVSPESRSIEVSAVSDAPEATKKARKEQRFHEAFLNFIEDSFDQSPFREGVKRLGMLGMETWKFVPVPAPGRPTRKKKGESNEDFEERISLWKTEHSTTMPFRLIPLHPTEVLLDPFNDTPKWGIHVKNMYVGEVESIYPKWENSANKKLTDEVLVTEYWDDRERAVTVNGESAFGPDKEVVKHRHGTHPFIKGASGFGSDNADHEPAKRYVGINRYIKGVLQSESRNYSVTDIVLKQSAWPVRIATGDRANEVPNLDLKYGQVHPFPAGVKIEDLNPSLPPDMVFGHQSTASRIISDVAAPRAIKGLREPGTTSGIDQQTQIGEARLKYRPIATGIERMMTKLCQKAAIYMRTTIKHPVSLRAGARSDEIFEIGPSAFSNPLPVRVKVNVLDPSDEIRKKNSTAAELAAGTIDQLEAIKELHPDKDAGKIQRRVWTDRMMMNPIVQQVIGAAIAEGLTQKLELADLLEDAMKRIQAAEQNDPAANPRTPPAGVEDGIVRGDQRDLAQDRQVDGRI